MTRTGWIRWFVSLVLRSRWATIFMVVVVTGLSGYFATKITIDTSLETWFLDDDATLVLYRQFRQKFGEDEFIVLALEADDVFTSEVLGALKRLTDEAEKIEHVRRVTSLTNVEVLKRKGRSVRSAPLMPQLPSSPEEAAGLRQELSSYPLIAGTLASKDGCAASILVELSPDCDTFEKKAAVAQKLSAEAENCLSGTDFPSPVRPRIAGSPVLSEAISRFIERDLMTFNPISFLVVIVSIHLLFRRFTVALISLTVVGVATLWVLGLMGLLGIEMNLLGPVLTMIVLVVGVADSIHIFAAYFQEFEHSQTRREAMERALNHVLLPCLVTSLTTIAGFLALITSSLEPIRTFGALAAVGTAFAFVLSVFLIPALLLALPERKGKLPVRGSTATTDWLLKVLGHPTRQVSCLVLVGSTLVIAFGVMAVPWLEITANPMNYFHADAPVRQDAEAVDAALGGASSLEFIVHAPNGGLKDLRVLRRLDAFEVWLAKQPSVSGVMSFGALLKEADRVQRRGAAGEGQLPASNFALLMSKNIMEKSSPELLSTYVQDDYSLGRISARVQATGADELASRAGEIEDLVRRTVNSPELQLEVEATGFIKLVDDMRKYLIRSQISSVLLAFAVITLMLLVLFRSWKLALFSLIPNVGPIIMGLAFMAVLGIRLDPGTVMIATIALGLVVDDTCHFLVRLRQQPNVRENLPDAIAQTMKQTGRPIVLTSVILAAGFSVLILGSFSTTVCFGMVSAFVLLMALVADLVMLPAALLILRPRL